MNQTYLALCYRKTVFSHLRRMIEQNHVKMSEEDTVEKHKIVCEDVPMFLSEIPEEFLKKFIKEIEDEEDRISKEIQAYDFQLTVPEKQSGAPHPSSKAGASAKRPSKRK